MAVEEEMVEEEDVVVEEDVVEEVAAEEVAAEEAKDGLHPFSFYVQRYSPKEAGKDKYV
jgi:hypothetical protein